MMSNEASQIAALESAPPLASPATSSSKPFAMPMLPLTAGSNGSLLSASDSGQLGPLQSPRHSAPSPALPSAVVLSEHNPFDITFGQLVQGGAQLDAPQEHLGTTTPAIAAGNTGGRIAMRTNSIHLLTVAAELDQVKRSESPLLPSTSAYPSDIAPATYTLPDIPPTTTTTTHFDHPHPSPLSNHKFIPSSVATSPAIKRRKVPAASRIGNLGNTDGHLTARHVPSSGVAPHARAPPSSSSAAAASRPSQESSSDDESKRERFLERNRVAAQKCRRRKKERIEDLAATTSEYERQNEALLVQVEIFKEQNFFVRTLLFEHRDCPVMQQAGLSQLFDSATRPSVPVATTSTSTGSMTQRPFPPLTSQMLRSALAGGMFAN